MTFLLSRPFVSVGLDPGTKNPALCTARYERQRWNILRLPVLHSLDELNEELVAIHESGLEVDVCCYEAVAWSLHGDGVKHGHGSGRILEAVGALKLFAQLKRIPAKGVAPQTWRVRAAGSAKATKEQVRKVLKLRVTGWPPGPVSLNRSDAVAITICGAPG